MSNPVTGKKCSFNKN